jgi:phosphoglycerate dehydrogenase-like enzyme
MKAIILSQFYAAGLTDAVRAVIGAEPVPVPDAVSCANELADADILFCQPSLANATLVEAINRSPRLRWVQVLGSGVDNFARITEERAKSLIVTNAAAAYGDAVAEHAVALALALLRRVPELVVAQASRQWIKPWLTDELSSLEGASAAVIGFGAIGQGIARRLDAFGCSVVAVRRNLGAPAPKGFEHVRFAALEEALPAAELLFLALPLTQDSSKLIDAHALSLMPRGARLINVSRGSIVATLAMMAALENGALAAAALDVFEQEPLPPGSPLWALPNVLISPHVAGRGNRCVDRRMNEICLANLRAFLDGRLTPG